MEKILKTLDKIGEINKKYDNSNSGVEKLKKEANEAIVCTPIIGKFSSGKSALVNTLIGNKKSILREDITPETAIPKEITYADNKDEAELLYNNGNRKTISIEEFKKITTDANTIKSARLKINNDFLGEISDVMLVDMPGFESGFEVHNKAIDNYLPESLAYIITFPADDMVVRSSVGNILKELCNYDMPLCIVITKYDKRNPDFEESLAHLKESLKKYVDNKEIRYCITSSFDKDVDELKTFLISVQEESKGILEKEYSKKIRPIISLTENYLNMMIKGSELSESELVEKEEKLNKEFSEFKDKSEKKKMILMRKYLIV